MLDEPVTTSWDFPRSVAGISLVHDFAVRHGVDAEHVLRGSGVTPAHLADADAVVPARAELMVLRNLASALPDRPALALELGRTYHVTAFGILGYALMSSRTVLDAMNLALRFLDLSYIFSAPVPEVGAREVAVALDVDSLPADVARFAVERDAAAIRTVLTELVPGGVPFSGVELGFGAPADPRPYAAALGVSPLFGRPRTVLRFDVEHLARRLPQANPHSQALAEAMCRDVVARRRGRTGLTQEVRLWITRNLAHDPRAERAAAALSMSPRTLRRRLEEAGVSYQALLDEVREALAEEMLATGVLGVEDVAQRLGYAEASSFIHAFKRWRGMTPARFRREQSAASGSAG
jgi:AraC-like DNA-binding protein